MRNTPPLLVILLSLVVVPPGLAQSVNYPENCITNVDNATTIIPSSVDPSFPNGASLAPGDTIAVQNPDGDCVGHGVWANDGEALSIAVAGPTSISEAPGGMSPGDSLSWTVFDESKENVVDLGTQVVYASCDTISVPMCRDDGTYADDAVFTLEAFQNPVYTVTVAGDDGTDNDAGWRMLSLPAAGATRASLEDNLDFSAMPWSVVRRWQDGQWTAQSSSDTLPRGTGFIFYFYDSETNPVNADGLQLDVDHGPENTTVDHQVGSLAQSEEWILLGNPFPVSFDLGALANGDLPAAGFQATVHVWDPDAGQYQLITQGTSGDDIAAWQGFFVQRSTVGEGQTSLTFGASGKITDSSTPLIGSKTTQKTLASKKTVPSTKERSSTSESAEVHLRLETTNSDGEAINPDRVTYRIDPRAETDYDAYDAEKLPPVSGDGYASATLPITKTGDVVHRALGAAPPPAKNTSFSRSIPLSVRGVGTEGTATLSWPNRRENGVPDDWAVRLKDTQTDSTVDLRRQSYTFALKQGKTLSRPSDARFRMELQNTARPAQLDSIKGRVTAERVSLRWKTTSERDNAGFRIERRGKGQANEWTELGFVEGRGTTDEPQRYRFNDANLPYAADTLHYRLRAVDKNGTAAASDTIVVARSSVDALALLKTFPNPVSHEATVRYAIPDNPRAGKQARLLLYDALGRRIRTIQASGEAGRHEHRLNVSNLASGLYILRLKFGDSVRSRKLTVVQ